MTIFKTSTSFIKAQMPGFTLEKLIDLYKTELEIQNANNITIDKDTINFKNNLIRLSFDRYKNRYLNFSEGQIKIVETEQEFIIYFTANLQKLYTNAGLMGIAFTAISIIASGFSFFALLLGLIFAVIYIILAYIGNYISFPIYFKSVRNRIEEGLQK